MLEWLRLGRSRYVRSETSEEKDMATVVCEGLLVRLGVGWCRWWIRAALSGQAVCCWWWFQEAVGPMSSRCDVMACVSFYAVREDE